MTRTTDQTLPRLLLGLNGVAILAAIAIYWGISAELLNRSLVVAASVWLLWRSKEVFTIGNTKWSASTIGIGLLLIAVAFAPLGWFLVAQVGPRTVLLWWLAAAWLAAACGTMLIQSGWTGFCAAAFPLFFFLFALPWPHRFEQPLQNALQELTASLSAKLLAMVGFAVQREGFVLRLPHGDLGVIEACSGVRSVVALTAIAALLAHLRGMQLVRGGLFVALSLPVVVVANAFRVAASGVLQESIGVNAVQGTPHELLGFASFLLGLAALVGLSRLIRASSSNSAVSKSTASMPSSIRARSLSTVLGVLLLTSITAAGLGWRSVERQHLTAPLEAISPTIGNWRGEDLPISGEIREMLTYDRASHRVYRDRIGQEIHVWVIFWSGAGSVRGYHHPDVCWPNRGWTAVEKRVDELDLGRSKLPLTVRRFANGGRRQVLCYWTQEGNHFWTDAEEDAAHVEGTPGHRWIRERLFGGSVQQSGRLSVLIGADELGAGDFTESATLNFCRQFAAELYRAMPWAAPQNMPRRD